MTDKKKNDEGKVFDSEKHTFQTIKAKPVKLKDDYNFFNLKWYNRFFSRITVYIVLIFMKFIIGPIFFGYKVINKKVLKQERKKKQGYIFISNHIHPLDAFLTASSIFTKRIYFTMLMTNLGIPFAGKTLRFLGGVPIPDSKQHLRTFKNQMKHVLDKGAWMAVYPESALVPYCKEIRPFEKGMIRFALDNDVDILPMVYVLKKPTGIYRLYKRKPLLHLHVLEPYKLKIQETKHASIEYNSNEIETLMRKYLLQQYDHLKEK